MGDIETDYLVVGAGVSGLAFTDTLLSLDPTARVVVVDREARPGGHWLHAYPFVRLHQSSANYGVESRTLGTDRILTDGPDAGTYERAGAEEICDYFQSALDDLLATGRVSFLGEHEYVGRDGDAHLLRSGEQTTRVRAHRYVDATYVESEVPSSRTPPYPVDGGATVVPPNRLPDLADAPAYTVVGAGKTGMDTCVWLLSNGVDPSRLRWVKPRESWLFDRAKVQPLELVSSYMGMQGAWVRASAEATDGHDFAHRLEDRGYFLRVDPTVEADMFRGAIIGAAEVEALRSIEDVVRLGRVRRLGTDRLVLAGGEVPVRPGEVFVDCTAAGVPQRPLTPVFDGDTIRLTYVTMGFTPWSAATIGAVEALRKKHGDEEKNRLCPSLVWSGRTEDLLWFNLAGMAGLTTRTAEGDIGAWNEACRLNPAAGVMAKASDPAIGQALTEMITYVGPALENLTRRAGAQV